MCNPHVFHFFLRNISFLQEYLKSDPLNRTEKDTRLIQIKQGYEPSTFTSHFHGWDHSRWQVRFLYVTFHGWNHCHCRIRYLCSNSTVGIGVSGGQDIYVA